MKIVKPAIWSLLLLVFLVFSEPVFAVTKNFSSAGLTDNIVHNPYQGLGICHYVDPEIFDDPAVSWAYATDEPVWWDKIEPAEGEYHWQSLDNLLAFAQNQGKKIWLSLYSTEGHTPAWAQTQIKMLGTPNDWNQPCASMNPSLPLPWDENYLRLWGNFLEKVAQRYEDHPALEAIVMMPGGCYDEMAVCSHGGPAECWEELAGGNLDAKFAEATKNLIDLYLRTFVKKPVILHLGAGLYGHTREVIQPVLAYALPKYGLRVLLKTNSWDCSDPVCGEKPGGCDAGHSGVAIDYLNTQQTRFGLEPAFWLDDPTHVALMTNCRRAASYACLQPFYWQDERSGSLSAIRQNLAKGLGARVALVAATFPTSQNAGQTADFSITLKNLGEIAPFRPQRQGIKDVAASYDLGFEWLQQDQVVYRASLTPTTKTNQWTQNQTVVVNGQLNLPANLPNGTYQLSAALFDPQAHAFSRNCFFRFLNKDLFNTQGKLILGEVTVSGSSGEIWEPPGECLLTTSNQPLPGDINGDQKVNEIDLSQLLKNWGVEFDATDLEMLLSNWQS